MSLGKGQMQVKILADGTVRVETSDMGGVAHKAADDFLKEMAKLLGGEVTVDAKEHHGHHHHHDHAEDHHHEEH